MVTLYIIALVISLQNHEVNPSTHRDVVTNSINNNVMILILSWALPAVWLAAVCAAGRTRPCRPSPETETWASGRTAGRQPSSWCSPTSPSGSGGRSDPPSPAATRPDQSEHHNTSARPNTLKGHHTVSAAPVHFTVLLSVFSLTFFLQTLHHGNNPSQFTLFCLCQQKLNVRTFVWIIKRRIHLYYTAVALVKGG